MKEERMGTFIEMPEYTWTCKLFGKSEIGNIIWSVVTPPCWFHRKMQYLFFGNVWTKINKKEAR